MRRGLALAALIAVGCGPSSYDDFRVQLASRSCDRAVRCGQLGASERQFCAPPTSILPVTVEEPDVAVQNGRLRFFSDAAEDCLDAVGDAPCDDVALLYRVEQRCHHVLEPGAGPGTPCWAGECEGGRCAGAQAGCMGTCVSYPPPGSPCDPADPFGCDPTVQWCDGACEMKKPQGASCNTDVECAYGYSCQSGQCGDPPVFHSGDTCPVIDRLCSDQLYCSSMNVCTPFVQAGGACDVDVACQAGNACVGLTRTAPGAAPTANGTCQPWADTSHACTDAPVSGCPATQTCAGGACVAAAASQVNVGERCSSDGDCAGGLYCAISVCRYRVALGGSCAVSASACLDGLVCDAMSHACAPSSTSCGF
jgi:hypothetical protein